MKYTEYKDAIDGLLTNPDTALAGIGDIYAELESDLTTKDSLATENEELKNKVKELQETNIKLFLSQSNDSTEDTTPEDEQDEDTKAVEEFFEELNGEEKKED